MTDHRACRGWNVLIAIALVIGVLILLIAGTSGNHGVTPLCFVLPSILLFGLVEIPRSLWPAAETSLTLPHQVIERSFLFQRPPPVAFA